MFRVGLTGGIASGKTEVGEIFSELGGIVVDADELARAVVAPGTPGLAVIAERFGPEYIAADGTLDRKRLAGLVFSDPQALADLNAITHPLVAGLRDAIEAQLVGPYDIVIHMIPLLVETGLARSFDALVVVDVDEDEQVRRAMARDGLSEEAVRARIGAQASRQERLRFADYVIRNDAGLDELRTRTEAVWHALGHRLAHEGPIDGC